MKIKVKEDAEGLRKDQVFEATVNEENPDYFIVDNGDDTFTQWYRSSFDILPEEDPINLEDGMRDAISKKLSDGSIEKIISEQLEKGIVKAMDSLIGYNGEISNLLSKKIKEVMVPYLEHYDYSQYITKLDTVLVDVLKGSALQNTNLLKNFKDLMSTSDVKNIKVSEIYDKWIKYVEANIETSDLEIITDDGVHYEHVDVTLNFEKEDNKYSHYYEYGTLTFECEKDEKMNLAIRLCRWESDKDEVWRVSSESSKIHNIESLRYLSEMEILVMRLGQCLTKVTLDMTYENDAIEVDAEPEASFR